MPTTVPTQYQGNMQQQHQNYQGVGAVGNNAVHGQQQAPGGLLAPQGQPTQAQAALQVHQSHAQTLFARLPQAHVPPGQQQQQQQQQFQRLKVEDALSYLDQVKLQFGNHPHVYNEFLDIMKEFKSQTIDTPGVINRVSNLFKGHSDLIVGFNTFLPPGYKIEVQANEQINVHQPGQAVMALSTVMGMAAAAQNEAKAAAAAAAAPTAAAAATTGPPASTVNTQNTAMQPATTSGGAAAAYRRDSNRPLWDNFLKALPMPQTASGSVVAPGASHHSYHQPLSGPTPQDANLTSPQPPPQQQPTNQPVEFNHAINYVNKIKNRFQGTPSIYKSFLEILHTYQKEQRNIKEGVGQGGSNKPLSESEVYNQVACLFRSQEDLLSEFGQFLPDANGSGGLFSGQVLGGSAASMSMPESAALGGMRNDHSSTLKKAGMPHKAMGAGSAAARGGHIRRASGSGSLAVQPPPSKKMKTFRDVPYSEAAKAGTLADYAFFDRVRKALKHEEAYKNFIRCLKSYNDDVVSAQQLVSMTEPFLGRFPELQRAFKDLVGLREGGSIESIPATALGKERIGGDYAKEIDFSSCKRLGASYRALPKSFEPPKCSGRTNLCKEVLETLNNTCFVVEESKNGGANFGCSKNIYEEKIFKCEGQRFETLNDVWVSFPSWSEDSNFVTGRKNQFEELIYRTEDERFQLDIVMEINTSAMMSLEVVQKKLQKMSSEEASKYKLDNCLGGTSEYINRKAVERIYGGKAGDIIEGLKKNPVVAVPLVLRRLKAKHDEWKDNQKEFNKQWRDQNEKYYLKSLDHQGLTFKQNDVKQIRSKALLNEIETIFDERQEAAAAAQDTEDGGKDAVAAAATGPHLTLYHRGDPSILEDAAALLVHHVARQSSLHGDDKRKIKQLLHHFLPDLFHVPRGVLSDDEDDTERQAGQARGDGDNSSSSIKEEPNDSTTAEESSDAAATTAATPAADAADASDAAAAAAADKENSKDAPMDVDENSTSNEKEKEKSKSSPGKSSPATTKADVEIKTEDEIKKEPEEQENKDQGRPTAETNGSTSGSESKYSLFFVSNNWYLFLRLHQLLCERLFKMSELAQKIAADEAKCKRERNESTAAALRLKANLEVEPEDYYPYLLERIKELLDGQVEASVYEDILREMYGIHAYTAFTMDKIVQSLVRTLQHLVSDDIDLQATELFLQEKKNGGTGGSIVTAAQRSGAEQAYQRRAEHTMSEENCFKVVLFADDFKLTIELLDTEDQGHSEADAVEQWSSYVENFVNPSTTDLPTPIREAMASKPIFMPRAVRRGAEGKCQPGEEKDKDEASGSGNGEDGTGDEGKRKMEYYDDTECKFNINSYKIVYVIKSESYFYKRCAFARARKRHPALSLIKHNKFWDGFMNQWMEKNLTEEHKEKCDKFFMGEIGDLKKCRTRCYRNNPLHKEPYHLYNRFRVQYLESDDEESQPSPEPMATDSN